ncbi:MAG: EamA family transporter [Candidatus Symbiobacter sp.]|nr:EamA family transporter [Candidatus Symbiobacter sp.]
MSLGYALAAATMMCLASGNLWFDAVAKRHASLFRLENIVRLAWQPMFLLGLGAYGLGTILWVAALQHEPLAYLYPFLASQYVLVPLLSLLLRRERPSPRLLVGFIILCAGLGFIIVSS